MSVDRNGPNIRYRIKNGEKRVDWFLSRDGAPSLIVADKAASVHYIVSLDKAGKPTVLDLRAQPAK